MTFKHTLLYLFFTCCILSVYSQKNSKEYRIRTIAFYNLENLFDTINNPNKNDEASPIMKLKSNKSKVYLDKIDKLGSVIAKIGVEKTNTPPAILGVCEVENKEVLEDLVQSSALQNTPYEIIHYESPDERGIDVALLYNKTLFTPVHHKNYTPNIYKDGYRVHTRDQLLVSGYLDDELIHVIVNHWPSRRGGEAASRPQREKAAYQNTQIIEELQQEDAKAKIIIMGDFNDDPINSSFKKVLKTSSEKRKAKKRGLYNPYENMFKKGLGTLTYRDKMNLFDQIIVSSPLLGFRNKDFSSYKFFSAQIFNQSFLTVKSGRYKGYPFRSFAGGSYLGGYSDHYPVYVYLVKEAEKSKRNK